MYTVSSKFRERVYSGGAIYNALLTINGTSIDISNIKSIKISDPVIDTENEVMYIGTFISRQVEISFKNALDIDLTGTLDLTIEMLIDGTPEPVPIGTFYIETSPEDYYKNAKITALDSAILFKPNVDISEFFDETTDDITAENLLKALCTHYGVTLGTYPNVNRTVTTASFDNTISGKQYISWIAEIMGGNAKISRTGTLNIVSAKNVTVVSIDAIKGKSFTKGELYKVSKVRYDNGLITKEKGDNTANTLNIRQDNVFINGTETQIQTTIDNIGNAVNGLEIWNLTTENYGDISLDSTDIVTYVLGDETYTTYYNSDITYEMVVMGKVNVSIPSKQVEETTNVISSNIPEEIRSIKTTIDQQANEIRTVATKTEELDITIENNYNIINEKFNDYTPESTTVQIQNQLTQIVNDTYTKVQIDTKLIDGSVQKVQSVAGTFDANGLTIEKTDAPTKGNFNETGLTVVSTTTNENVLFAGYDKNVGETVVNTTNLTVDKYLVMVGLSRFQPYTHPVLGYKCVGCYWANMSRGSE